MDVLRSRVITTARGKIRAAATVEMRLETLTLEPVGIIYSEHREHARTPIQPVCAQGCRGWVEVFPAFAEALDDIEGFSTAAVQFTESGLPYLISRSLSPWRCLTCDASMPSFSATRRG